MPRILSFVAVVLSLSYAFTARAEIAECLPHAVSMLKENAPQGYQVYAKSADDKDFSFWLHCNDATYGLPSAVHETVHHISSALSKTRDYAYYTPDGRTLRVERKDLFPRSEIAAQLTTEEHNRYFTEYLTGNSGNQDLLLLLDELNAYTHGVATSVRLNDIRQQHQRVSTSDRDGLAHFMYYTQLYLRQARLNHPAQWKSIVEDKSYAALLRDLWSNAYRSLRDACGTPELGINDGPFLKKIFQADNLAELKYLWADQPEATLPFELPEGCGRFDTAKAPEDTSTRSTSVRVVREKSSLKINGKEATPEQLEDYKKRHPDFTPALKRVYVGDRELTPEEIEERKRHDPEFAKLLDE